VERDMNLVMGVCDRIVVLNFGEILGREPCRDPGSPGGDRGLPRRDALRWHGRRVAKELASRLSDVEDSYPGRTGPGGPGQ
jgi:hypothetical protein